MVALCEINKVKHLDKITINMVKSNYPSNITMFI